MKGLINLREVYLDMIFAVNLGMDWLILWVTAVCLKKSFSHWRLFLGALVGALYAVLLLLPSLTFLTVLGTKLVFSLIMIRIAFDWVSIQTFLKTLSAFYLVSFLAGGGIVGIIYLVQGNNFSSFFNGALLLTNLPIFWLFPGILILFLVGFLGTYLFRKHLLKANYSLPTLIYFDQKCISAIGFVDTGNHLREPFTKRPVIILEASLFTDLLPISFNNRYQITGTDELELLLTKLKNTSWEKRVRLIPFSSLGTKGGLLLGLIADEVHIKLGEKTIKKANSIIGIYPGTLCAEKSYQALLHPELLNEEMDLRREVAS